MSEIIAMTVQWSRQPECLRVEEQTGGGHDKGSGHEDNHLVGIHDLM